MRAPVFADLGKSRGPHSRALSFSRGLSIQRIPRLSNERTTRNRRAGSRGFTGRQLLAVLGVRSGEAVDEHLVHGHLP